MINTTSLNKKESLVIVTENVHGERYVILSDSVKEVLDDWQGECEFVPGNDAKVYFAMVGDMVVPESASTFERAMGYITSWPSWKRFGMI